MRFFSFLATGAFLFLGSLASCSSKANSSDSAKDYIIKTDVPKRKAGQKDVLGLVTPKLDTVRVGFIGLGMRGASAVHRWCYIDGTKIVALADIREETVKRAQETLKNNSRPEAAEYFGEVESWKALCDRDDIDLVYISTDWENHVPMALYAMEKGKHVAVEVPAAMNLKDIWAIIDKAEEKQVHCMMLENCVYDFFELSVLNMAQHGVFGEITHVEGAYIHNLEEFWDEYWEDWRLKYNKNHRGDIYPTHGFGPAAQLLDIHRGDKFKTLVSMDTKAFTGEKMMKDRGENDSIPFQNGDHTTTILSTENGKTMLIEHNVMNPRPYSRMYQVTGTNGFANKYPIEQILLRPEVAQNSGVADHENLNAHRAMPEKAMRELLDKYKHPIQLEIEDTAKKVGGHGGMDYIMDYRLVYCLRNGLPLDMDVYDLAEWSAMTELTRISIENGNAPVEFPDFTRGNWNKVKGYRHAMIDNTGK